MQNKLTKISALAAVGCMCLLGCSRPKSSISPPPTADELSLFRIVTNQFGTLAIQQREGTNWTMRPNRWSDEKGCRWDMEWWIAHTVRVNTQEVQSAWQPR